MSRSMAVLTLGVLLSALLGCKKEREDAPRVPTSGPPTVTPGSGRSDAGAIDAGHGKDGALDEDGGLVLQPMECRNVEAAPFSGEDPATGRYVNALDEPSDLKVTRVVGTWELACRRPKVRLEMSDGKCPEGKGHQLVVQLDAIAIESGAIASGAANLIVSELEEPNIRIRYTRPNALEPTGEWGNCSEAASGSISFRGNLETDAFTWFEADFNAQLPACDGSDNGIQSLSGSFYIQSRRGVDEACPAKMEDSVPP